MAILVFLVVLDILSITAPSERDYVLPPAMGQALYKRLWGFNWSDNLNLEMGQKNIVIYAGTIEIIVEEISYQLFPSIRNCSIHGWLYYRADLAGTAPGILLVHGLGLDHEMFEKIVPIAYRLAKQGFVVLSIDAPGHGKSCIIGAKDWKDAAGILEPIERNLFYQVYVASIRGIEVLKKLSIVDAKRLAVLGVSMGGMAAIVVGSIHPDVRVAIPIVASGCITCMIESGGFANLIGPPSLNLETISNSLAAIDPVNYALRVKGEKWFLFLFSTHDEYFAMEGLRYTVSALKAKGCRTYVLIAPNNDHYGVYSDWMDAIPVFLDISMHSTLKSMVREPRAEHLPFMLVFPGSYSAAWRPAIRGLAYIELPPLMPLITPMEGIGYYIPLGLKLSTPPVIAGFHESIIMLVLFIVLVAYIAIRLSISFHRVVLAIASLGLAIAANTLSFVIWPGRFALSLLDVYERYGVILSGLPSEARVVAQAPIMLYVYSLVVCIGPVFLFFIILFSHTKKTYALTVLYAVPQLVAMFVARLFYSIIAAKLAEPLPIQIHPLESLVIAAAAMPLAVVALEKFLERKKRKLRRRIEETPIEEGG